MAAYAADDKSRNNSPNISLSPPNYMGCEASNKRASESSFPLVTLQIDVHPAITSQPSEPSNLAPQPR
eukprot:scaffold12547_cov148-Skeletonema_marinoi.AAC.9